MAMSLRGLEVAEVVDRACDGDRRALGRVLSWIEAGEARADEVNTITHPRAGRAHVVGITGAPGAGKSTLTGRLTREWAARGRRPAVLAVDPSSPLTGGAILGDRIRMDEVTDESTFIRSVATRGHSGGLALSVPGGVRAFDAAGHDPVTIETVGVGQVEVDVVGAADTTVVVVNPGWGDAVQANKAGLLEVADIFVVNKADRPGAHDARRDLELMLDLSHVTGAEDPTGRRPPIVMTTATEGTGAAQLCDAIEDHLEHLRTTGALETRRAARDRTEVLSRVDQSLQERARAFLEGEEGRGIVDDVVRRHLPPAAAGARVLASMLRSGG